MAAPSFFQLLVEASWGSDPPKNLSAKLQMYFQSPKRSGGGECEVLQEPGHPARFLVLFRENGEGRPGRRGEGTSRLFPRGTLGTGARGPSSSICGEKGGVAEWRQSAGQGGAGGGSRSPRPAPDPALSLRALSGAACR